MDWTRRHFQTLSVGLGFQNRSATAWALQPSCVLRAAPVVQALRKPGAVPLVRCWTLETLSEDSGILIQSMVFLYCSSRFLIIMMSEMIHSRMTIVDILRMRFLLYRITSIVMDISKTNMTIEVILLPADAWGQRYADPDLGYYTCDDGVACLEGSCEIAPWLS